MTGFGFARDFRAVQARVFFDGMTAGSIAAAAGFGSGLLSGLLVTLVLAAIGAAYAYRRFVLLERRTRHAERLAELGTLTGGLAHEIKNPLSTVQLNLQLLQEDLDPDNPAYTPHRQPLEHRQERNLPPARNPGRFPPLRRPHRAGAQARPS